MADAPRNQGMLDVIRSLAAQGASGRLQINTGKTDGALFFDRGELVDARLANLNGFQAVNALASVPGGTYSFDPSIRPPAQNYISSHERVLLKDFFGIEPAQPVDDEVTLVRPRPEPIRTTEPIRPTERIEPTEPLPISRAPQISRSSFRPALLFIPLVVIILLAAVVLMYRLRQTPDSTPSVAQTTAQPTSAPADVPPVAQTDLTGNWNVVNTVDQTSYQAYKNMKVGFNVSINQNGKDFTGKGEKISENGQSLPAGSRTPITVRGTIDGDKVEATFSESGAARKTNGRFSWRLDKKNGGLTGTFVTNAARSSGRSAAKKGS